MGQLRENHSRPWENSTNTKGVWEEQRASRDIFSLVGPAGFSKYLICQMKAVENYRLNPTGNRNENAIVSALGSLCQFGTG